MYIYALLSRPKHGFVVGNVQSTSQELKNEETKERGEIDGAKKGGDET